MEDKRNQLRAELLQEQQQQQQQGEQAQAAPQGETNGHAGAGGTGAAAEAVAGADGVSRAGCLRPKHGIVVYFFIVPPVGLL